jgi:hypothetical protein
VCVCGRGYLVVSYVRPNQSRHSSSTIIIKTPSCFPRPTHAPIFQTFVGWSSSGEIASRHLSLGALLLVGDTAGGDALDDVLAVLVELELGDFHLGGSDADGDGLAVGLLAGDALNVNDVLEAVHRGDLALTALVGAALDDDLVVLADGDGADLN